MAAQNDSSVRSTSDHGTGGSIGPRATEVLRLAPTTANAFNTVGQDLQAVACLSLHDLVFDFGSSFVLPEANGVKLSEHLSELPALRDSHRNSQGKLPLLSIFGHADPVGSDAFNQRLSGRRAKAVYALLTHNPQIWTSLYNQPIGRDDWRARGIIKTMRNFLGDDAPADRAALFQAYMSALNPTRFQASDFLGRGTDFGGKADYQGCGEFNPLLILSEQEEQQFSDAANHNARNTANQTNRRVVIYLFCPAVVVDPKLWPCPRMGEGVEACHKRFYADASARRAPGPERREFRKTKDTFACRFYDRIARNSPCETGNAGFKLILENELGLRIPEAAYEAELADGSKVTGKLGCNGAAFLIDPPPGPIEIQYPDYDDIKAKSLAARARKACKEKNVPELHFVLGHSRPLLKAAAEAYAKYFDTLSGQGMAEDIYAAVSDAPERPATVLLMARGGLPAHEDIVYYHWDEAGIDS